jgi:hypothetical protein
MYFSHLFSQFLSVEGSIIFYFVFCQHCHMFDVDEFGLQLTHIGNNHILVS